MDGAPQSVELTLLPDAFATNDAWRERNPLFPATVRALDANGQERTLIWRPNLGEFCLAYTFPPLFEGIGTENPRLIAENLDQIPFIPIEDIQNGLAAQSVLLAMKESGYQPFTEEVVRSRQVVQRIRRFFSPLCKILMAVKSSGSSQKPMTKA